MSVRYAERRLRTIVSACALAAGVNRIATNICPSSSSIELSTVRMQRFQRGSSCLSPNSFLRHWKFSSTNGLDSAPAFDAT